MTDIVTRSRASAVVLHRDHVLLQRGDNMDYWALPGGGIEPGELADTAVRREMQEELYTDVQVKRLLFIAQAFFTMQHMPYHQIDFHFHCTLPVGSPLLDLHKTHYGVEDFWDPVNPVTIIAEWYPVDKLHTLPMRIKPGFLAFRLAHFNPATQHVICWED
jgi:ADP-ribose pyrophosphatase YjhB (NUDIX family)